MKTVITYNKRDYIESMNEMTDDPKNAGMFKEKIGELEQEIFDLKSYTREMYHRELDAWFFEWIQDLTNARIEELEKHIRKMDFYRMKCLGQTHKFDVDIETIKTIPIKDIIGVAMTNQSKNRAFFPCPLHNEKKPSFVWYKNDNSFYCFGCAAGGSVIDLYMKLYSVSVGDAIKGLKYYL